jgi:hypothetical protein
MQVPMFAAEEQFAASRTKTLRKLVQEPVRSSDPAETDTDSWSLNTP